MTGKYKRGERIASETEIVRQHKVSRATAIQAIRELENEGLVFREQGRGTFVAEQKPKTKSGANLIGVVVPNIRDTIVGEIVAGVEEAARNRGYHVLIGTDGGQYDRQRDYLRRFADKGVAGFLFVPSHVEQASPRSGIVAQLNDARTPFVLIDQYLPGVECDCVVSDNEQGGYTLTEHLLELGHRRVGFISEVVMVSTVADRLAGYRRALAARGILADASLIRVNPFGARDFVPASVAELLALPDRPTAIFAVNDWVAAEAIKAIAGADLRVPQDIALVTFDDLGFFNPLKVTLTTMMQPARESGEQALGLLLQRIEDASGPKRRIVLPSRLIVRESSGGAIGA